MLTLSPKNYVHDQLICIGASCGKHYTVITCFIVKINSQWYRNATLLKSEQNIANEHKLNEKYLSSHILIFGQG